LPTVDDALAEEGPTEPPPRTGRPERMIAGSPDTVRDRIDELLDRSGADEVMAMTNMHGFDDRVRSYELLADAFSLTPRATPAANPTAAEAPA
jgi:alkanesulfonate monooxygenase SsuD/methylene tetrahydromethanopterin reductase-like flavin-dependent oxidoreductase (luciferase family)